MKSVIEPILTDLQSTYPNTFRYGDFAYFNVEGDEIATDYAVFMLPETMQGQQEGVGGFQLYNIYSVGMIFVKKSNLEDDHHTDRAESMELVEAFAKAFLAKLIKAHKAAKNGPGSDQRLRVDFRLFPVMSEDKDFDGSGFFNLFDGNFDGYSLAFTWPVIESPSECLTDE